MTQLRLFAVCGVLALAGTAHAALVNGGFETETPAGCQVSTATACSAPPVGWSGNAGAGVDTVFPNSGNYDAILGSLASGAPGLLSQAVATTAGVAFNLSFAVFDESASPSDTLTVSFGTFSATIRGDQVPVYATRAYVVPGSAITSVSTTLSFSAVNALSDFDIDDVAAAPIVTAVPEAGSCALLLGAVAMLWLARLRFIARP